ncbi:hypothetical protein [Streptomyces sp. YIM 98790]|uniref:hypothetical protein n=1 Tax=Streptomyces sp. YIM 98790 TaxID=2689077 RepID=UPI001A9D71BD|nr:hypothetical protein [Streptomyces sp. YIM 98790]
MASDSTPSRPRGEAGAVVLLHDGGGDRSPTVEAVARTIPGLKAQGRRFGKPARHG